MEVTEKNSGFRASDDEDDEDEEKETKHIVHLVSPEKYFMLSFLIYLEKNHIS